MYNKKLPQKFSCCVIIFENLRSRIPKTKMNLDGRFFSYPEYCVKIWKPENRLTSTANTFCLKILR